MKAGSYAVFLFVLVGVHLYGGARSVATGGEVCGHRRRAAPAGQASPARLIRTITWPRSTVRPARYLSIRMG